ncbi:OFA family MFS transporter [Celerinatantimonas sp. YJH-8]|uniref:OFA family MFS transporter n=1 Tax=Celerinatantimonas sp. YJH-8 TaxID=3228714 RepID=UPI0038C7FB1E
MTQSKISSRALTLIGTIITQFALGSVYTWSLFNSGLAHKLSEPVNQVAFSFGLLSLSLAIASSISGKLQERFGVRNVTIAAGLLMGIGFGLTSVSNSLIMLYICGGILLGFADGTGYLMTLSNCVKLFPEKKGLISALSIGAYGLGSLGFKYINLFLLNHYSLATTFQVWGLIAMVMILIGACMMHDAPNLPTQRGTSRFNTNVQDLTLAQSMTRPQYWMMALIFLTICMSGLYIIGVAKDIGQNYAHLGFEYAAQSVAIIALANLLGRLVLGILSDKMSRIRVVSIAVAFSLAGMAILLFTPLNSVWFFAAVACIAFSFGGTITVYPSLISDFFGMQNLTKNYGFIYLGFGVGSLTASVVASLLGGFIPTFYLIFTLLVISLFLTLVVKAPQSASDKSQSIQPRHHNLQHAN